MPPWLLIFLGCASLLVALCSLIVSLLTYSRNQRWRDTDEGKVLVQRIEKAEKWNESPEAKDFRRKIEDHGSRLTKVETKQQDLATKADIARLEAEFDGLQQVVKSEVSAVRGAVDDMKEGVGEIRRWIMQESKG